MNDSIVVMSYSEKLWWEFVDAHPNLVMWGMAFLLGVLVVGVILKLFKKGY